MKDYLHKFLEGSSEPEIMEPTKTGGIKYDRHFRNAGERSFEFTNTGKEPLCIVSGKQTNFLVSPPIGPGTKLTIRVKANKKGHEFGVILASDYYPNIASAPKLDGGGGGRTSYLSSKSFSTKMFDAIIVDVERFNIWGSYGDYNAAAVKYDQTEKILNNTRIKQYEEQRRFSKRDLIDIVRRLLGF